MSKYLKKTIIFAIIFFPISLFGMFMRPTLVPVDRLIANTKAYIKKMPGDHNALYMLARIHYLAFINKSDSVFVYKEKPLVEVAPDYMLEDPYENARNEFATKLALKELGLTAIDYKDKVKYEKFTELLAKFNLELQEKKWEPESKIDQAEIFSHIKEARINFEKAILIAPKEPLYSLGLACLYVQYLDYKFNKKWKNEPKELQDIDSEKAKELFFQTFSISIIKDIKLKNIPVTGMNSIISYEAGNGYLKISKEIKKLTEEDQRRFEIVTEKIKELKNIQSSSYVTPIVFNVENQQSFSNLIAPDTNVLFDLDGDGKTELWPWVKSTTGFLVWDPQKTGKITSGRQMFGSVTWWIFFQNGYQALDALDDNRDGQLMGDELIGITTWFDKNSNGISEPGEMIDLQTLGIKSIGTKPTGEINGMPMHSSGITLSNGEKIPTYDWIASPTVAKLK